MITSLLHLLATPFSYLPVGLISMCAVLPIENYKYAATWKHEFVGTLIMIFCTFSAGKWVGVDSWQAAWVAHAIGVVAADKIGGGPHVNPAVSTSMLALGKCGYTEYFVRVCGAMAGGLVAFPLFLQFSDKMGLNALGGPAFSSDDEALADAAMIAEFTATFLLCIAIYALNWELNFGKFHYWIKQFLTAVAIRALIEFYPQAGPAMNPMLGTTWATFDGSDPNPPSDTTHYLIYWLSPCLAAIAASVVYVIYAGGTIFGKKLPIGPLKPTKKSNKKKD